MKKYFYYFVIAGTIGFIVGFFLHNKTEPEWNVIWNLNTNTEFNSKLKIFSNMYELRNYPTEKMQLVNRINDEIMNFSKNNENFETLKDLRITNINANRKKIRFNTNNIIKSEQDLKTYIEKLNIDIINKLKIEIDKSTILLKEEIKNDLNLEVTRIENFLNFIEKNNLNLNDNLSSLMPSKEDKSINLIDDLTTNPKILVNNKDDIKNLLNGYKNPRTYNQLVSQNKILNDYNRIYKILENDIKIIFIKNLDKSINRQPNKLFMSFSLMFLTIILLMLFFGLKILYKNKLNLIKFFK